MQLEGSINIAYGILHHIFQILDAEDVPVKQIIPSGPALDIGGIGAFFWGHFF